MLILPDNGIFQVPELNAMVQEVNETKVERQEQLSDKVQFCDGKTAVMENAERREARLEKEKAAEKAEVKGGIHGRLEKAKAEIKAKEGLLLVMTFWARPDWNQTAKIVYMVITYCLLVLGYTLSLIHI